MRIKGQHVSILTDPQSETSVIATLSGADSVERVGRLNNQWSQVQLRDGREGFVANQYLEDVAEVPTADPALDGFPIEASHPTDTSYSYTSPATYAAPAAAYGYAAGRAGRRFRRGRSGPRFSRRAPAYRPIAPVATPSRPAKTPAYSATYSTVGSSYRLGRRPVSNSYRPSSSSAGYQRTYSAPRVNYTFRSSGRSPKRRR